MPSFAWDAKPQFLPNYTRGIGLCFRTASKSTLLHRTALFFWHPYIQVHIKVQCSKRMTGPLQSLLHAQTNWFDIPCKRTSRNSCKSRFLGRSTCRILIRKKWNKRSIFVSPLIKIPNLHLKVYWHISDDVTTCSSYYKAWRLGSIKVGKYLWDTSVRHRYWPQNDSPGIIYVTIKSWQRAISTSIM